MLPKLSIVTVHKGPLLELERTIDSIYSRLDDHTTEHIVVARLPESDISACRKLCDRSKFVLNEDKSLYDAMNIGIRYAEGKFVNFLNSGDELCAPIPSDELKESTCYICAPTLNIGTGPHVTSAHGVNHQNFFAPNDKDILFEEEYRIFADAHWMNQMIKRYGTKRCQRQYATFHYGGISTRPSLGLAFRNIRMDSFLLARLKLLIKALLIFTGLERINKYMLQRGYR